MRVVFVSKHGSKKDYLVLATIQYKLAPSQIIQFYARRWLIEIYFKTAKQFLALIKFIDVLVYLIDQLKMIKGIDEDKLTEAVESFIALLPEFIQLALEFKTNSANIEAAKSDTAVVA